MQVQLVPSPLWGKNLRSKLSRDEWRQISRAVRKRNKGMCEICNIYPAEHCHEVWKYEVVEEDVTRGIQTLVGLSSVCPECHAVHHMGRTLTVNGQEAFDKAVYHMARVNKWSVDQAYKVTAEMFVTYAEQSKLPWRQYTYPLVYVPEAAFLYKA